MENQRIQIVPYEQYLVERVEGVGHNIIGYDKNIVLPFAELFPNGKPIRFGLTWDKELETMRPDWDVVAALGRKWEKETRTKNLQKHVMQYQAGDKSVLHKIENGLEALAYSAMNDFSFESSPDTAVFLNEAGEFDKYIPKAPDTEDLEDEKVEVKKIYVRFVPFSFSDEDFDDQFPKSVKAALKTYNPNHKTASGKKTLFSTWFFRRFKLDLKSLYKKYKGDAEKIMTPEQYDQKGLSWSQTHTSIPDKTNLSVNNFTPKEADWMSLVLESYPCELSVDLRCKILNIKDRKTDINRRESIAKKLGKWRMLDNKYGELYLIMHILGLARTRPPAEFVLYSERFRSWGYVWQGGRRWPRVNDGYVGDMVLDNSLLKVKGFNDPTPQEAFRGIELPANKLVPARSNWYRDKDGLKVIRGSTGECKLDWPEDLEKWLTYLVRSVKQGREIPVVKLKKPRRKYYVYNHTRKVYCENVITRSSLVMGIDEWAKEEIRREKERKKRLSFAIWVKYCKYSFSCKYSSLFRIT